MIRPVVATLLLLSAVTANAQSLPPIAYTLSFPAPHTHYVEVEARVPTAGRAQVELMLPVWTPGSYLVREFARHVEDLRAEAGGRPLGASKSRKNRWRIETGGADPITVRYRVYSRELSVRTNFVDSRFAVLNGAPTFLTLVEAGPRPHEVAVTLPPEWKATVSPLAPSPSGAPHRYVAPDYDTLVDSPLVAGNPSLHAFVEGGARHVLANEGEAGVWDGPRSAADVQRIVQAYLKLWGRVPYDRYVFFNLIVEAGGGLEHRDSTVLMTSRWRTGTRRDYLGWLSLVSHEYFHVWNVKRLRPVELGPFDYENEVHTANLWVGEGFTDYYDGLMVRRAGLSSRDEYLEQLSNTIRDLQTTPGRLVQSAAQSSYDAWIKLYRPDENSPNSTISYYTKGGVIGFLLDARVRVATNGARTLDDVMRLAYERHSGTRGFTTEEFRRAASEVAGVDLSAWFARAADSTEELDYDEALDWFGLRFKPGQAREDKGWLGATTKNDAGRLVVSQVRRGTPAHAAGLNVDDEILAIDAFRVRADQLDSRLEHYRPGQRISVLVARRDELVRIDVTLGTEPGRGWSLEVRPDATAEQRARLAAWLWE